MKKITWFFLCTMPLLLAACDQAKESSRVKENTDAPIENPVEKNTPVIIQQEASKKPLKKALQKEAAEVITNSQPVIEKPPALDLNLENIGSTYSDQDESDMTSITETESAGQFDSVIKKKSRQKRLNITGDVTFAEDVDETEIRVEDIIEKIDGAEVQLEYKF